MTTPPAPGTPIFTQHQTPISDRLNAARRIYERLVDLAQTARQEHEKATTAKQQHEVAGATITALEGLVKQWLPEP